MLSDEFLDWWFTPWDYALDAGAADAGWQRAGLTAGPLGARDAYRVWCGRAGIVAELPRELQPGWHVAGTVDGAQLLGTARLFGGLLAVREQERAMLAALSLEEHRWCAAIASTQPLGRLLRPAPGLPAASLEAYGLAELAWRLEYGFAGMWPRLRLLLEGDLVRHVDALLAHGRRDVVALEAGAARGQRCWQMCRQRLQRGVVA
ncbi:MAG: hypothetical protein V4754_18905 [Pseudomonadota bacterium]